MKVRCIDNHMYKDILEIGKICDAEFKHPWWVMKLKGTTTELWSEERFEEVKEMTKSDLKVNDVLVFERDRALIVSCDAEKELAWFSGGGDPINVIGEDLQKVSTNIGGKLVNVYRPRHRGGLGNVLKGEYGYCELLWERQEKSEAQIKLDKLIADKEAYDKQFNKQVEELRQEIEGA